MAAITATAAILGALANAGGALAAYKKNKENENDLLAQRSDIDRELATSAMDNIATQAYFKQMDRNREKAMAGIDNGIIAGGATAENALAQKQKLNESFDNAAQNFLINKENQKRGWLYDRRGLTREINANRAQQAQNWVTTASNVANAVGNLGEAYLDMDSPKVVEPKSEMAKANDNGSAIMANDDNKAVAADTAAKIDTMAQEAQAPILESLGAGPAPLNEPTPEDIERARKAKLTGNQGA